MSGEMPRVFAWTGFVDGTQARLIVAAPTKAAAARMAQVPRPSNLHHLGITQNGREVALATCFPGSVFWSRYGDYSSETAKWYRLGKRGGGKTAAGWLSTLKPRPVPTRAETRHSIPIPCRMALGGTASGATVIELGNFSGHVYVLLECKNAVAARALGKFINDSITRVEVVLPASA